MTNMNVIYPTKDAKINIKKLKPGDPEPSLALIVWVEVGNKLDYFNCMIVTDGCTELF